MTVSIPKQLERYRVHFSESAFWAKFRSLGGKALQTLARPVLTLYYVSRDPSVPVGEKLLIYGALGYLILPTDLIPDMIAGMGFVDDLSAIAWVLHSVQKHVTPEISAQVEARLKAMGLDNPSGEPVAEPQVEDVEIVVAPTPVNESC